MIYMLAATPLFSTFDSKCSQDIHTQRLCSSPVAVSWSDHVTLFATEKVRIQVCALRRVEIVQGINATCQDSPCYHDINLVSHSLTLDHGAHTLVCEQLHENSMGCSAVNDVGSPHTLCQAPDAAVNLGDHAACNDTVCN